MGRFSMSLAAAAVAVALALGHAEARHSEAARPGPLAPEARAAELPAAAPVGSELDGPLLSLLSRAWQGPRDTSQLSTVAAHDAERAEKTQAPIYAYPAVFSFITCVILVVYGHMGWKVVLSVMAYLTALSTMKLSVKWVFVEYAFTYPKFVTGFHFVCSGLVCLCLRLHQRAQKGATPIALPTASEFAFMILPISLASSISIGADNMALGLSSVAFTEILGSTTCICTCGMVLLMGMPFNKWLLLPTSGVAIGCALSTAGEVNASVAGMLLVFLANAFRSTKAALQQKLMTGEYRERFDPCTLLMWVSLPSSVIMHLSSVVFEGHGPYREMASMDPRTLRGLWVAIGISCINAVMLNLAQLFVTKHLGAVGGQIVGQAKAVLTVLGGMALFGEQVTRLEVAGFALVLCSVYTFSWMESQTKAREQAAAEESAPLKLAEKTKCAEAIA